MLPRPPGWNSSIASKVGRRPGDFDSSKRPTSQRLNRFGTTEAKGYVHIPIDDAMELVVARLSVRKPSDDDDYRSRGLVNGGESNSGRKFRGGME